MGSKQSAIISHGEIHAQNPAYESSTDVQKILRDRPDTGIAANKSTQRATDPPEEPTDPDIEVEGFSERATRTYRDQVGIETESGESSKCPRLDEGSLLDRHGIDYRESKDPPCGATNTSLVQGSTWSNHADDTSSSKAGLPSNINLHPRRLPGSRAFLTKQCGSARYEPFPKSRISSMNHPRPNTAMSSRLNVHQLAADGQQGMKVLFFVDHATRGDAIHYSIQKFVEDTSPEMILLMNKYRKDRDRSQTRFFVKARTICAQLTSRHEFLGMDGLDNNKSSRLAYFRGNCSNANLSTLYSHIESAVDIPKILAARTPNERAFKDLMTQVFIHTMEDLWCFEFHPSKQNLSAKLEKMNKEDVYNRFKNLTDPVNGLPAARTMPGYLEVPLRASFPRWRYVLPN